MSLVQTIDWIALAPPTVVAVTAVAVLLTDLFLPEARKRHLGTIAAAGLALALLTLLPLHRGDRTSFCLADRPDVCSYSADTFAVVIQLIVLGGALIAALLTLPELTRQRGDDAAGALPRGEFWFLLLASASGAALLPAARDLATLVLAMEVTTLPAYALVALRRGDRLGPEAALKFFLTSVVATAVTLLGISFVYAGSGSLFLGGIADGLAAADPALDALIRAGVVLTLVGFAFKTAAVPFHFWVPDTYLGAPLPVAAYLSVVSKTAGLAGLVLVTSVAFAGLGSVWGPVLAVLAALTMTAGNVAALRTRPDRDRSTVRLLAWSSVAQAGYLLVPLAAAGYARDADARSAAIGATVAYAVMYAVVNLGTFAVAAHVAERAGRHRLTDHRGLHDRNPLTALALGFFLLCLAGLPPGIAGLFAKIAVIRSAVQEELAVLAVVAAVNVVIALVYYLRWAALLFRPAAPGPDAALPAAVSTVGGTAASADAAGPVGPAGSAGSVEPGEPGEPGEPEADTASAPAAAAAGRGPRPAAPVAVAIAVTALLALALSVAPQLMLGLTSAGTFF
ncbi:NADH-quinone oxidoreductase subunit N [Streptomyces lonarensis]|uniref:NADH-quinone oxidoreductase subunit N n=1 Tax=Streptomyces lonarensis TaxID=700599 RepID=A0A7X6D3P8_9ACTN|nr:NADH-quinone oxidoreductase subunit N [Streptomyces lonarensis]NJQ07609.1 NADH-quinone oxidoreductase subunit N [Streptomyces lonarensis]